MKLRGVNNAVARIVAVLAFCRCGTPKALPTLAQRRIGLVAVFLPKTDVWLFTR